MKGFKDIKYDIPVCHKGHKGHEGHKGDEGHENFRTNLRSGPSSYGHHFFNSVYLFDCDISDKNHLS